MTTKVLSIAGNDPSGGAGIEADLKAFSALNTYGMAVVTSLVAENTKEVTAVYPIPASFVSQQLDTLLDDIVPDATKIGMLATAEMADMVSRYLPKLTNTVLDPVMVATSGDPLLDTDAISAVRKACCKADLITPNLPEAAVLLECEPAKNVAELKRQATQLLELGVKRVLVKGGHLDEGATDIYADSATVTELSTHRINTKNTHGTGCTLSSAIAALRPQRASWLEAVRDAKQYLTEALAAADSLGVGHGHGPVHHFIRQWSK